MEENNNSKRKIYIYARKSKFTKESESIEEQIDKCRKYIEASEEIPKDAGIEVFCDEGKSGKDLNRPEFQKMYKKIMNGECRYVIVYRLDRISRSVADFSRLLNELQEKNVLFISATEKGLDGTSALGQLMVYITSAFAEFERQIIAERVRDNMHKLAQNGRWLGGRTPLGFNSKMVKNTSHIDDEGDIERTEYRLVPNADEIETVRLIYKEFLKRQSLTNLETFLRNSNIRSRNNRDFTIHTLKSILRNPVYCTADREAYEYFQENGCELCLEDKDLELSKGFMSFNKTQSNARRKANPMSEWILAVGKHNGIISGNNWVKVQRILDNNADKGYRKSQNPIALLSGVLKCSCGSYMRPKYNRPDKNGNKSFVYMCEQKERSHKERCDICNLNGRTADKLICDILLDYELPTNVLNEQLAILRRKLSTVDETNAEEIKKLQDKIAECEAKKANLFDFAGTTTDKSLYNELEQKLIGLSNTIKALRDEIAELENTDRLRATYLSDILSAENVLKTFKANFETLSTVEKRDIIKRLFDKITWDGENLSVFIHGVC